MTRTFAALVIFLLCFGSAIAGRPDAEQKKIDYLITSIETLEGATFIRNGSAYDAPKAADHMRLKLRYAGDKIQTADEFIDELGTKSSMSGVKYLIKLKDGRVVESAQFFHEKLAAYKP
jgi:hypothetical protein